MTRWQFFFACMLAVSLVQKDHIGMLIAILLLFLQTLLGRD